MDHEPRFPVHFGPFTPADYLAIVVLPTLAEFTEVPDNRRRMYLACIAAAHMVDHVARTIRGRDAQEKVRKEIASQGDWQAMCIAVIEGICNGTKHAGPGREQGFRFIQGQEVFISSLVPGLSRDGIVGNAFLPGFTVNAGQGPCYIDDCVRAVIRAFVASYPTLLAGIDITSADMSQDRWSALYSAATPAASAPALPR